MAFTSWREPVQLLEEGNGPATPEQRDLANLLVLPLGPGQGRKVAAALLEDHVEPAIHGRTVIEATDVQLKFLGEIAPEGADIRSQLSRRVASAWIDYYLAQRTITALRTLKPQAGNRVVTTEHFTFEGKQPQTSVRFHVVSSIGANGRVYFSGGRGAGAWPSQLRSVSRVTGDMR